MDGSGADKQAITLLAPPVWSLWAYAQTPRLLLLQNGNFNHNSPLCNFQYSASLEQIKVWDFELGLSRGMGFRSLVVLFLSW